ncbi:hypothetical protein EGI31_00040 [Lacihabitans soyangensis]|uniref:Uncharacterized protein n=1 Tax=Lacihabitans soyangensis TaxID=869394 RepID=A0AAE3GZP1_9BACT|nr:hypothetical protein [Lacihabitans soyangensis]
MQYLLITIQVLGSVSLYYWFFFNSEFFYLLNKHKNAHPLYLFFLPLLFISYPAILALAYKIAWDFFDENVQNMAFLISVIPISFFLIGLVVLKKIKSL